MTMAESGRTGSGQQRSRNERGSGSGKGDRSRRSWSDKEDRFLLGVLKELVVSGWKSDNGFRSGCLSKAEDAMRMEFPGTDIRQNPHIQSKIHIWKNRYYALSQILSRSGVGFNHKGDHKIDCDDAEWTEIIKANSRMRSLRNKSWPYYEDWQIIFGKDRASGDDGVDMREAFDQTGTQSSNVHLSEGSDQFSNSNEVFLNEVGNDKSSPECPQHNVVNSPTGGRDDSGRPGKKRKGGDGMDKLVNILDKIHEKTDARLEYLANRIGYEFDLTKARKEVFELVAVTPGLTLLQVFDASEYILSKVEHLDFFMSMPVTAKATYVYRALDKIGGM